MQNKNNTMRVIDISHWDTVTDWQQVKDAGVDAVYAKATDGTDWVDPMFINFVRGAQSVGLPIGAYHFLQPHTDPVQQAQFFKKMLETVHLDLMPVLDVEKDGITLADVQTFIKELGHPVIFYSYTGFIQDNFPSGLSNLPLWIADYRDIDSPPNVGGWAKWTMWQYTEKGTILGISSNVDISAAASIVDLAYQPVDMIRTTTTTLNIRTGPGPQYGLADDPIKQGTKIHLDKIYGNWAHTTYGPIGGWVNRNYLIGDEPNESQPTSNK